MWATASPEDKLKYEQLATNDKLRHDSEMKEMAATMMHIGKKPTAIIEPAFDVPMI